MPFVQLATAANIAHLAVIRAGLTFMLTGAFAAICLPHGLVFTAWAAATASALASLWFMRAVASALHLPVRMTLGALLPGAALATVMLLINGGYLIPALALAATVIACFAPNTVWRSA